MLFNSIDFALFFPLVFILYWFVVNKNLRIQNIFIVVVSFVFYGWWNWRFLSILALSCVVNFVAGILIEGQEKKSRRKMLLWAAIAYNLGLLVVFKYLNFFIDSFTDAFTFFGFKISGGSLNIVLPVGISFFTFQALGYIMEVYRKNFAAARDFISFSAFVSFFPLILAGPIERAPHLLPQFYKKRKFDYSLGVDGSKQILWGLFTKIVIADNCAEFANMIFNNAGNYSGGALLLGALLYTIQIYADFSGYSNIAIGVSKLLGFDIIRNFNNPYLSLNVADFWRRWHIALSSWFRDYLYSPLSIKLRNWGTTGVVFSLFVTFLLCGLWHGANYTFIIWGGLHGLALGWDIISFRTRKKIKKKANPYIYNFSSWGITFLFIIFTWIFFRAENITMAVSYIYKLLTGLLHGKGYLQMLELLVSKIGMLILLLTLIFIVVEFLGKEQQYAIAKLGYKWKRPLRWGLYLGLVMVIFLYAGRQQAFIYFQF